MNDTACRRILVALVLILALASVAEGGRLYLLLRSNDDPWIASDRAGNLYKLEWYGGSILFWKGDVVLVTSEWGFATMLGLTGASKGQTAKVWVKKL